MKRFAGRTVVVTGSASGIGFEMSRLFLDEGANVFGGDLATGVPPGCREFKVDVQRADQVADLISSAVSETGRLDVLCNNAGIGSTTDAVDCSLEEWDRVFAVNVRGVFLGTKYALPHMLNQRAGVIVNTASVAGLIGLRNRAAYCASKGAVVAFTRQVAVQYAGTGVRCNCICPGTVESPWVGRLLGAAAEPDRLRAELVARQPIGRLGEPTEVAKAALYLASDDASFVTGSEFVIDGGIVAG